MSSMLQDILETPGSLDLLSLIVNNIRELGSLHRGLSKIFLVGAGSSYYASMYAASHALSGGLSKCIYVVPSSEFIYNYSKMADSSSLVIAVSRSGETAETLEALRVAKRNEARTMMLSISDNGRNVEYIDNYVFIDIGQERSIVMTKSFITLSAAAAILLESIIGIDQDFVGIIKGLSTCMGSMIKDHELNIKLRDITGDWVNNGVERFVFLGNGSSYPIALETALKFEETSYAAVQALNTLEFRHGPVATIGEKQAVIMLSQLGAMSNATVKLFNELRERSKGTGTRVLMVTNDGGLRGLEYVIYVSCRTGAEEWDTLTLILPMYLLANQYALRRGIDVEKPRNLTRVVRNF